jgi:hypothetical protein
MEIRLVGAEFFHADRQTDGRTGNTKLIVTSRHFAKAPKSKVALCCIKNHTMKIHGEVLV